MSKNEIRKKIEKLNEPNNYLSGIYNYCDRWCERCSYTGRCLNYSPRKENELDYEGDENAIESTMDSVFEMFEDINAFLKEEADKKGIDLTEEVDMSEYENAREKANSHSLAKKSHKYFQLVHDWFESREELVTKKTDEYIQFAELGLSEEKIEDNLKIFHDAIEVIQWYFTMIRVKIIRALHTKFDTTYEDTEFKYEQENTSAKIALIGCEKSLNAWKLLYEQFSEDEDEILHILGYLDVLRKEIIEDFPNVTSFKRPYFD